MPAINAKGPILLLLAGSSAGNLDPDALATLDACFANPAACNGPNKFLYPTSRNPGFKVYGNTAELTVRVNDTEPASLALLGVALAGIGAIRGRRRRYLITAKRAVPIARAAHDLERHRLRRQDEPDRDDNQRSRDSGRTPL